MGTRKTFLEQGLRTNNKFNTMCGFTSTFPLQTWGTFTLLEGVCSHTPNFYSTTLVLPSNQTLIILLNPPKIDEHGEWCLKKVEPRDRQSRLSSAWGDTKCLNCKYPGESHTVYKNQALFSLNVTPYFAPKDVKNFSVIEDCFARVKKVWLSWVWIQRCKACKKLST